MFEYMFKFRKCRSNRFLIEKSILISTKFLSYNLLRINVSLKNSLLQERIFTILLQYRVFISKNEFENYRHSLNQFKFLKIFTEIKLSFLIFQSQV